MKILLCHERFVFRFGVDRVLLMLAREFRRAGHHVTLLGCVFDDATSGEPWADRVVRVPVADPTLAADVEATAWLASHWEEVLGGDATPEVVLDAGWPFLSSIPLFEARGCRVVYQDHGIIPDEGMPEIGWRTLSLLRELKDTFVRQASGVVAVSRFIRETQNAPSARAGQRVEVIPNGTDHLDGEMWNVADGAGGVVPSPREGAPALRVLCPGRFEPGNYKQSELVFALEELVRSWAPEAWIGVFATAAQLRAAAGPARATKVVALGHPSDAAAAALLRSSDVSVCFSRWEGFNLPLAEAQRLGRPCLVFDVGAHREVVADPWLLCRDIADMDAKLRSLVDGTAPPAILDGSAFREWASLPGRSWSDVAERYLRYFENVLEASAVDDGGGRLGAPADLGGDALALSPARAGGDLPRWSGLFPGRSERVEDSTLHAAAALATFDPGDRFRGDLLIMDVTNASRDPSNSGCVRVTRRLGAEWQRMRDVLFVVWERSVEAFRFPTAAEFTQLGAFQGPARLEEHPVSGTDAPVHLEAWLAEARNDTTPNSGADGTPSPRGWLLLPEIRHREDLWPILEFAARIGLRTASIFHDAIPLQRPDLVPDPAYREGHADYMRGLSRVDLNVANSRASAGALRDYLRAERLSGRVAACLLPGGLSGERPTEQPEPGTGGDGRAPFILMVSTLEPRKGFRRLIDAFLAARHNASSHDWQLVLVGGRSWWSREVSDFVEDAVRRDDGIVWHENATDERLRELYRDCAFTVYASEIEGFGLPIVESIWHGRPCLCHHAGVMAELAASGGCVAADLLDRAAFEAALLELMNDAGLRERLAQECRWRSVKRWTDYAAEFLARMAFARWSELEAWPADGARPEGASPDGPRNPLSARPSVSFILPTYNRLDLLQRCLASLVETLPAGLESDLIVVDDASDDGTREWLEQLAAEARAAAVADGTRSPTGPLPSGTGLRGESPRLRLLRNPTNRGYGAAVNRAARVAAGELLVLLNHDLRFRPGWLEPMLAVRSEQPQSFAIGNLQYAAADGSLDHAGMVFNAWGHPEHFRADEVFVVGAPWREFPAVTFACVLVDRRRFQALGGFDGRFLNGFEDVDLCLRARFQGWPSFVANHSAVEHRVSATPGRKVAEAENVRRFFARWHLIAVTLGRDWAERLSWERGGFAGMPDDSRRPGPWRVLVDLMPYAEAGRMEVPGETFDALRKLPRRGGDDVFAVLFLAAPGQFEGLRGSEAVADGDEVWVFDPAGETSSAPPGWHRLREATTILARRLEADVLFCPVGVSRFVCPDVPVVVASDRGDDAMQSVTMSAGPEAVGGAMPLADRLLSAVRAFAAGSVSWRWAGHLRPSATGKLSELSLENEAGRERAIGDTAAPLSCLRYCIDEPADGPETTPMLLIRGWCLDLEGGPITGVVARTPDGRAFRGVTGLPRPDVARAFPGVAHACHSGFSVRVRRSASVENLEVCIETPDRQRIGIGGRLDRGER